MRDVLLGSLTAQRRHVLGILDGLDDVELRRPVLPTAWNCVGLVHHLAVDVERFWFRAVMANEPAAWASLEGQESAWRAPRGRACCGGTRVVSSRGRARGRDYSVDAA